MRGTLKWTAQSVCLAGVFHIFQRHGCIQMDAFHKVCLQRVLFPKLGSDQWHDGIAWVKHVATNGSVYGYIRTDCHPVFNTQYYCQQKRGLMVVTNGMKGLMARGLMSRMVTACHTSPGIYSTN